ncbi:MAG: hypothetical protein ACYC3W_02310 [Candidatus Nanopelagicales bacterium]
MFDFKKLSDPEHIAQAKAEREAAEAAQEALYRSDSAVVEALRAREGELSAKERSLVGSAWGRRLSLGIPVTDRQRSWLHDICGRLDITIPSTTQADAVTQPNKTRKIIIIVVKELDPLTNRETLIVSHGIDAKTDQTVILPSVHPDEIGARFDPELREYVVEEPVV